MVIFGRTSALLLAMVMPLYRLSNLCDEALRLPERTHCAKFALVLLVAGAGFEPTTQRL